MKFIEDWKDQFDTKDKFNLRMNCTRLVIIPTQVIPSSNVGMVQRVPGFELLKNQVKDLRRKGKTLSSQSFNLIEKDPLDGPSAIFEKELTLEIQGRNSSLCSRSRKR